MELFKIFGTIGLKGVDDANRELNGLTDNAEKTGGKLSKFGSVMKGVGVGALAIVGGATAGAVKLVKSVSSSYGALQQSIGGIETLFKDSADKVIQNANNAYKTAGISANEYMQQVTSFSASLLQALDGDTAKASESADMAIRDMADNANKMGTSMEMIQNAYQGFAKQNYTMLDNLKLGYGGTKTEMQRLLKDAQAITGVKYDIKNLDDVYQAIHVMQGELGITGTTAKEAGETIEGSFNSLGASWQNFIAGLGDPNADMQQLVKNLASGINGAIKNVTPIVMNIVKILPTVMEELINAISQMLPTLIETFTDLITKVIDAIVNLLPTIIPLFVDCIIKIVNALLDNLPLIIQAGIQLVLGLAKGIADALPQLMPQIVNIIHEIINVIVANLPLIIEIGVQLLLALITGITEALPQLIEMLPDIIIKIIETLIGMLPMVLESGDKILFALVEGIARSIPKLLNLIITLPGMIFNTLMSNIGKLFDSGDGLMSGLLNGIRQGWENIKNFFKNIKLPHIKLSGSINPMDWFQGNFPKIGIEWYAKGGVMTQPTLFGVNPATGNAMVGGEAGAEAIAPIDTLQAYVSDAVKEQTDGMNYQLEKIVNILGQYLPEMRDNMATNIVLDDSTLVGKIAKKMDNALGSRATSKARFGV